MMPYIPPAHRKYDLLPRSRKKGGEVFSYPSDCLWKIESLLPETEGLTPYGYKDYAQYDAEIDCRITEYGENGHEHNELGEMLIAYQELVHRMNHKEEWSVLKYIGPNTQGIFGLTHGRYYYWPCSTQSPKYEGVIDDEEFTSYLYSTDPELWEIAEDPTGMAAALLKGRK